MHNDLREALRERLRARPYPILAEREASGLRLLPGAALWSTAVEQMRRWRSAGLMPGDVVLDSPTGIDGVIRIIAALVGGFVYWPVAMPRLKALIGEPAGLDADVGSARRTSGRQVWQSRPLAVPMVIGSPLALVALGDLPSDTAVLLETRGTSSGSPALVALGCTALLHQLKGHAQALDLREGAVRACVLPWSNAFGLVLDLLLGLWSGQALWIAPEGARRPRALLSLCRDEEIDHLACVPRVIRLLLRAAGDEPALRQLRIHSGGARADESLVVGVRRQFGGWADSYGLTECGPGVLLDGHAVDCEVQLDAACGELRVRTPSLGHFAALPERRDGAGWFRSLDLAQRTPDGRIEILWCLR